MWEYIQLIQSIKAPEAPFEASSHHQSAYIHKSLQQLQLPCLLEQPQSKLISHRSSPVVPTGEHQLPRFGRRTPEEDESSKGLSLGGRTEDEK